MNLGRQSLLIQRECIINVLSAVLDLGLVVRHCIDILAHQIQCHLVMFQREVGTHLVHLNHLLAIVRAV